MKLYLIRHTQTNYNVQGLLNADPTVDVRLTKVGISQAQALSKKLEKITFNAIYVSELSRTQQTANYINKRHGAPIIIDPRLNDTASGFEGRTMTEYLNAAGKGAQRWHEKLNGDESLKEVRLRVVDFIKYIKNTKYDSVLVVTSSYILECIYGFLHDLSFEDSAQLKVEQGDYLVYDY